MSSIKERSDNQESSIDIIEKLIEKFSQQELGAKQPEKRNSYVYKDGPLCLKRKRWVDLEKYIQFVAGNEDHGANTGSKRSPPSLSKLSRPQKEDTVGGKKPSIPMETILLKLGSLNFETDNYQLYSINMKLKMNEKKPQAACQIIAPQLSSHLFGVVTPNEMPAILSFPVYSKSAEEMEVNITSWHGKVRFRKEEWGLILMFHDYIFSKFLNVVEFPMMFSPNNAESSMLLVPLSRWEKELDDYGIDWNLLKKIKEMISDTKLTEDFTEMLTGLSTESNPDVTIMPRYVKQKTTQYCHVVRVCNELSPNSPFPSERFESFRHYYIQEYNKEIKNLNQPLLETNLLYEPINAIKRRDENRRGIAFQTKESSKPHMILYNVPELCDIHPMPSSLLQQAFFIPSILYRIISLLVADELREMIAKGINDILGEPSAIREKLCKNNFWSPLSFERNIQTSAEEDNRMRLDFDQQPALKNIKGPSPGMILRCLTTAHAQDAFDADR